MPVCDKQNFSGGYITLLLTLDRKPMTDLIQITAKSNLVKQLVVLGLLTIV